MNHNQSSLNIENVLHKMNTLVYISGVYTGGIWEIDPPINFFIAILGKIFIG